jgi:hypothetical protein
MAAALLNGRRWCLILYVLCFLFICLQQASGYRVHYVGGGTGWTNYNIQTDEPPDYVTWASSQRVIVGDVLVFRYPPEYHNVYSLPSEEAFSSCNYYEATQLDPGTTGTYYWIAHEAGVYYFACFKSLEGLGSHCELGQKLAVAVEWS